jgi:hypothetical protein
MELEQLQAKIEGTQAKQATLGRVRREWQAWMAHPFVRARKGVPQSKSSY